MEWKRIPVILIVMTVAAALPAGPRDSQWAQVQTAMDKGLPQTAIGILEQIIPETLQDQAYAEAVKAECLKIALEGQIQGNLAQEKITRLQTRIGEAPAPMQPLMEMVLAHWYWEYFQQNRWRILQRTQTAEPPGEDFETWDLARLLTEIDHHVTAALAAESTLQAMAIREYDILLERGTVPDAYEPTLYDFLVHEALDFYNAAEQAASQPLDAFEIPANSPIFAPVDEFLAWGPVTAHTDSARLKAIRLYQDLLTFHQHDVDQSAFLDADLQRLRFGHSQAVGPDKDALYEVALERFVNDRSDHELSAEALYARASLAYGQGDYVRAHALAQQGVSAYPKSIGGMQCQNLIHQIEIRYASVRTERVWNDPWPNIEVTYRNVTQVFFRIVPFEYEDYVLRPQTATREAILAIDPVLKWREDLPATTDFKERTEVIPAPSSLEYGFYFLIASEDSSFENTDNSVSSMPVWVSGLALVIRNVRQEGAVEGLVLNGRDGTPVVNAGITRWVFDKEIGEIIPRRDMHSDPNGMFRFVFQEQRNEVFFLQADYGDDKLASENLYRVDSPQAEPIPNENTVFFTDRSIYRPGQTIHYKGICLRMDTVRDDYQTLPGRKLTVVFRDTNGQEIERCQHQCNDYGSFSGSVTAPRDRLTGQMSLFVEGEPSGSTYFSVEEYRRPTFRVAFDPPVEAPRLDTEVTLTGRAAAYTGAAVDGAQVQWRVERRMRFPAWNWWARAVYPASAQTIAYGTAVTAVNGSFEISFTAKPDPAAQEADEPVFVFRVYADVTDMAGETRSSDTTIAAGFTALQAAVTAPDWQTVDAPVNLTVSTDTLDGQPEPAQGQLLVYALKQPDQVTRAGLPSSLYGGVDEAVPYDAADPATWELADLVEEASFATDATGRVAIPVSLPAGVYRAVVETQDRLGKPVQERHTVIVLDPGADHFGMRVANHFSAPVWSVEPGETFSALWGTGYATGRAWVELECRGEVLYAGWTDPNRTQTVITQDVTELMRGGFTVRVTYVRENRAYINERIVDVPWTNQPLTVQWERFRSLLEPGQQEQWTAIVTGPDARAALAEMVAALYDASLDQFRSHNWVQAFSGFRRESSRLSTQFENRLLQLSTLLYGWNFNYNYVGHTYRRFPSDIVRYPFVYSAGYGGGGGAGRGGDFSPVPDAANGAQDGGDKGSDDTNSTSGPDLDQVDARENLNETAFFFPHLRCDRDGEVRVEFTMPEALTEWRFIGFAHDNDLRSGYSEDTVVTAKDLMVRPNAPRFVREGDVIEFTVQVSNQSAARQTGRIKLTLSDARTLDGRDTALGNLDPEQTFDVPSMASQTLSWRLTIPDGCEMLIYKAVGATDRLSDGEEGYLPVLSRRILVTESLPLPVRGAQTKDFEFTSLLSAGASDTLQHQSLAVQMVSQPAWYAVMALPYLMEAPHACSERIFNRLYANSLAAYIANSDPKIRRIFDQWKNTNALDSPLEQNEDLKAVLLEETPWVRQAQSESQARRHVGILFDTNRLTSETSRALFELNRMQLSDGLWPWFPGLRGSKYVTCYIVTGFGRLRHLGLSQVDVSSAVRALGALDEWMDERYQWIQAHDDPAQNHLSAVTAYYFYGRSFFLADQAVAARHQEALDFWLDQARQYWLSLERQSQAHLALALLRFGDLQTPGEIMQSIREYSVTDDELGMYWRDQERSWWWYRAPIETQTVMIEAFDEVLGDAAAVDACRTWLLKQKQTQDWETTRATADAVYALLLRGTNWLASDALVEVALGGEWIVPEDVEAGTGYYEKRFVGPQIEPAMGHITVRKADEGVSWGSVHWQYLEDMAKVTAYAGTPLQLHKDLFVKRNTDQGPMLFPAQGPLAVGDELVVRIELRVDRDMEYVHLKDQRPSGTEPVSVLSGYRYQDGLGYYQSTQDTATHFFMDVLPKGVYVFEYSTRVQHKGSYQTGIALIQCLYAPEFNSHSESYMLQVQ